MMTMMMSCRLLSFLLLACGVIHDVQASTERRQDMVGGYFPVNVKDPAVQDAARFAVKSLDGHKYEFLTVPTFDLEPTVLQAWQQVVAGSNYKLVITLCDKERCLGAFEVTIYDRFGDLSITNWGAEMTCDEAVAKEAASHPKKSARDKKDESKR